MILKQLAKHDLSEEQVYKIAKSFREYSMAIDYLLNDKKVIFKYLHSDEVVSNKVMYVINPAGLSILEESKKHTIEKWFTRAIAIVALIISIISLLKP